MLGVRAAALFYLQGAQARGGPPGHGPPPSQGAAGRTRHSGAAMGFTYSRYWVWVRAAALFYPRTLRAQALYVGDVGDVEHRPTRRGVGPERSPLVRPRPRQTC